MNIKTEVRAIRKQAEEELGFPLVQVVWDMIEDDVGDSPDSFDGDPEGYEEYLSTYRSVTERWVEGLGAQLKAFNREPSTGANVEPSRPKKRYRKCFERRFYLIDFVAGRNTETNRISWKRTVSDWNKAHPSDTMSLPVLKAEYYRALQDSPLCYSYLAMTTVKQVKRLSLSEKDAETFLLWASDLNSGPFPPGKDIRKSFQRLLKAWKRMDFQYEKQQKEAQHERTHTEEG